MNTATRTIKVEREVVEPDFTERIARGAALLDNRFGTDWRDEIDTSFLDLADGTSCVLGQVFVEGIVNGAVRTVAGKEHYYGGVDFLFPQAAYEHLGNGSWINTVEQVNNAASYHGFLITQDDKLAWESVVENLRHDQLAAGEGEQYLYEVLTHQWCEYLKSDELDTAPIF